MNYKLSLVYAWCAYVLTILVTFSADYYIRISGDDFYYSGLNEYYWIAAIVLAVSIGGCFIIDSIKSINKGSHKIVYLVINITLGFIFYAVSSYVYVVGFGIDSV
jgi:hypothetical protein